MLLRCRCLAFFILMLLSQTIDVVASDDAQTARDSHTPSFRNDVMAVLARSGCSLGTCHGNQNGKGGLKLSLRGQDPESDFVTLTRQLASRRINVLSPGESLLLRKPSMQVPHEGGRRFSSDAAEYQILRNWIAAGMPADAESAPCLIRLNVAPIAITLHEPQYATILKATAAFSDGSERDVTSLAGVRNGGHRYSRPESGDRFLAMFGKPSRLQTCECERTGETTLAQTMEMVSGELITELLRDPENRVADSVQSPETVARFLDDFWWSALSRPTTQAEVVSMLEHVKKSSDPKSALQDIAWAVLNSNEFLLQR